MGALGSKETEAVDFSREAAKRAGREAYRQVKVIADVQFKAEIERTGIQPDDSQVEQWTNKTKEVAMDAAKRAGRIAAELAVEKYKEMSSVGARSRSLAPVGLPSHLDAAATQNKVHCDMVRMMVKWAEDEIKRRSNHAIRKATKLALQQAAVDSRIIEDAVHAANKVVPAVGPTEDKLSIQINQMHLQLENEAKKYVHLQGKQVVQYIEQGVQARLEKIKPDLLQKLSETSGAADSDLRIFHQGFESNLSKHLASYEQQDTTALQMLLPKVQGA